jgi:hypothetical protein
MFSNTHRRILRVFIGSPGDLMEERKIAHDVVRSLNAYITHHLDIQIELIGWEDTRPGSTERPQELINQDLKSCDLFVGLLWNRFGSKPDKESKFDSGFEEEFTLAQNQLEEHAIDDVWLFFKQMTLELQKDPGEQARKVISFKKEVESEFGTLYKTFETTEQWREMFTLLLADYILNKIEPLAKDGESIDKAPTQVPEDEDREESFLSLDFILSKLKDNPAALIDVQHQRAHLYTFSLTQKSSRSSGFLEADEIVSLYHERESIELTSDEKITVIRELMSGVDTKPGWFWIDLTRAEFIDCCRSIALNDNDLSTRVTCFDTLTVIDDPSVFSTLATSIEKSEESDRKRLLEVYIKHPGHADIEFLKTFLGSSDSYVKDLAAQGMIKIVRENQLEKLPDLAFELASDFGLTGWDLKRTISNELPNEELMRFLTLKDDGLRFAALSKCYQAVKTDELRRFCEDKDENIRILAYHTLISRGEQITKQEIDVQQQRAALQRENHRHRSLVNYISGTDYNSKILEWDDVLFEYYKTLDASDVEDIDWISLEKPLAWGAIVATNYDEHKDNLRENLLDRFGRFRAQAVRAWEQKNGRKAPESFEEGGTLDKFIRSRLCKIGLEVLVDHHTSGDIPLVLSFFELPRDEVYRREILKTCTQIIKSYASELNYDDLVNVYNKTDYDLQRDIAKLALSNSGARRLEMVELLLKSDNYQIVKDVLKDSLPSKALVSAEQIVPLLYKDNWSLRITGLEYLMRTKDRKYLLQLLDSYSSGHSFGYYYYDVLCWMDRILYSPKYVTDCLLRGLDNLTTD